MSGWSRQAPGISDMTKELTVIEGLIRDHFVIEGKLFSTPLADAYKAVDRYTHSPVLLWIMKFQFDFRSEEARCFEERLQRMQSISSHVVSLLSYGVDSSGTGFVALPSLHGFPLISESLDKIEAERRFASCVEIVERLHAGGVVCGDLSPQSFFVGRNGQLSFVNVIGMQQGWFQKMDDSGGIDPRRFVAPEVQEGAEPGGASDVFSLGVLGYVLLADDFPIDEESEMRGIHAVRPLQRLMEDPPSWGDKVLLKCLEYDESLRFRTAGEMREAILEAKRQSYISSITPVQYGTEVPDGAASEREGQDTMLMTGPLVRHLNDVEEEKLPEETRAEQMRRAALLGGLGGLTFVLLGIVVWLFMKSPVETGVSTVEVPASTSQRNVHQAIAIIGGSENAATAETATMRRYFDDLADSADPLAQDVLVKAAVNPQSNEARLFAERAILKRADRIGFKHSSLLLQKWLDTLPTGVPPRNYELMLRSIDPTLPPDARTSLLRQLIEIDPNQALTLAAAAALDNEDPDSLREMFAGLVKLVRQTEIDPSQSIFALMLAVPATSALFGPEVMGRLEYLDNSSLLSIFGALVQEKDSRAKAVIDEINKRQMVTPVRGFFLSSIKFDGSMNPATMQALVHAATGRAAEQDVRGLGMWIEPESERVLLALCAESANPAIRLSVFDILVGRPLAVQPAAALIKWVREHKWESRGNYVRFIGVIGTLDLFPPDALQDVFATIDANASDAGFMYAVMESAPPVIVNYILEKHRNRIPTSRAFDLLTDNETSVKMAAMKILEGLNDAPAMRLIIEQYEKEKDPVVRQAYKDTFWYLKQR